MKNESSQTACTIVGEVAQAHDGSLGMAHAYIDAIARAGANAVKFQTHIAEAESTPAEPWRVKFSPQDETRFDYWKRMEFTEEQWSGLKRHADERGLMFVSSPFSLQAVDLLSRVGVAAWKIASGEVTNPLLLSRLAESRLPVILSTGMSSTGEIDRAVGLIKERGLPVTVLQCTSAYPCPPERIGLNLIPFYQARYDCPAGLSDHSGTIYPGLAAVVLGAQMVEVHVTFSREMFGPDVSSSVTTAELRQLVEGIRFVERMKASPVDKDRLAEEAQPLRLMFMKSIVAREDLAAGTILEEQHVDAKKPGTGIPANELPRVVGKRLRRSVSRDEMILPQDLDEAIGP